MKVTKQYFPVVLFIMLNKVVLTFESTNEILKCPFKRKQLLSQKPFSVPFTFEFLFTTCLFVCLFVCFGDKSLRSTDNC